jgi:glycosyltransferase involved in cell wall biosynthesis
MKIQYLAAIRMPTEKAHGLQVMKTCEALKEAGAEVELVVPNRRNTLPDEPFAYYGMKPSFTLTRVGSPDLVNFGALGFGITLVLFAEAAHYRKVFWQADIIYSRDALILAQYVLLGRKLAYEAHTKPTMLSKFVARRAARVVVISKALQTEYEKAGVASEKIILAPDGVDLDTFAHPESKESARARLQLPTDKKIALYIGKLDIGKGVDLLCEAAEHLAQNEMVVVIGGDEKQTAYYKNKYPKVTFLGSRPYRELADNQAAADVLVIPNTGKDAEFAKFTSPLKLFSAMASSRPIIAADVPSLREVLDDTLCTFFEPDNATALAAAISETLAEAEASARKATKAREVVEQYSWKERAKKILCTLP